MVPHHSAHEREEQPEMRSLDTLKRAHSDFLSKGKGDSNHVKNYYNAIGEPFSDIPLDQVVNWMWLCVIGDFLHL